MYSMHLCMYAVVKSMMYMCNMSTAVSASPGSHQNQPFVNKSRVSGTSGVCVFRRLIKRLHIETGSDGTVSHI